PSAQEFVVLLVVAIVANTRFTLALSSDRHLPLPICCHKHPSTPFGWLQRCYEHNFSKAGRQANTRETPSFGASASACAIARGNEAWMHRFCRGSRHPGETTPRHSSPQSHRPR